MLFNFLYLLPDAARKARALAEEAFFQPSIMSHLYLPLEHHFAIYAVMTFPLHYLLKFSFSRREIMYDLYVYAFMIYAGVAPAVFCACSFAYSSGSS